MHAIIVIIASYFIAIPLSVVLYELFTLAGTARLRFMSLLAIGGALSLVLAKVGARVIHDPRPFMQGHFSPLIVSAHDNGFPSDHTLLAAFIGFAVLSLSRRLGIGLLVIAMCIGLARMAAGVHHSWDVLGSFVITGVSYLITQSLLGYLIRRREQSKHTTS